MNKVRSLYLEVFSIILVSFLAVLGLFYLIYFLPPIDLGSGHWVYQLSLLNAFFNSCAAICLIIGLLAIKKKRIEKHAKWMKLAFLFSALFLVSYLVHHRFVGDQKFYGQGALRWSYFGILISHILLSVVNLPMILLTFWMALKKRWDLHKRLARWTFPIWLYVSVTGVLIVFYLKVLNPPMN
jgi:putative membrane protein